MIERCPCYSNLHPACLALLQKPITRGAIKKVGGASVKAATG